MEQHLTLARRIIVVLVVMSLGLTWETFHLSSKLKHLTAECGDYLKTHSAQAESHDHPAK